MVTILLPVHNDEKFLEFTIRSLLDQTFSDFKCLIGFNGTVDNSKKISNELIKNDKRFTLIDFGDNKGKSLTLNNLLDKVETEYVCLIDGDDVWHTNKLESQIRIAKNYDVIGTLCYYIDENNQIINSLNLAESDVEIKNGFREGHNQIINSSAFFKTECAKEIGGWDSSVEGLEDFDFWVRLYLQKKSFYNIQQHLVYHRIHKNSNFNSRTLPYSVRDILLKNKIYANTPF
jgi:glycosyltransferase involved in cell wall biosynthesis